MAKRGHKKPDNQPGEMEKEHAGATPSERPAPETYLQSEAALVVRWVNGIPRGAEGHLDTAVRRAQNRRSARSRDLQPGRKLQVVDRSFD